MDTVATKNDPDVGTSRVGVASRKSLRKAAMA